MPHKFHPENIDRLLSPERREKLDSFRVLSLLPVLQYDRIADIGCGPGYFTIPFAKHLYDGRIYAIDIQQEMLDAVKEQADRIRLSNVEVLHYNEGEKLPLNDEAVDGAFVAFMLHEADSPRELLDEARRILRRSGWLALLEWHKREMDEGPPLEIRISEDEARVLGQDSGFRIEARYSLNDDQYMLIMRK
ncbi:MAG: class I SAM-dependent methyltransferase [Ardenticatenaceae bacterium]